MIYIKPFLKRDKNDINVDDIESIFKQGFNIIISSTCGMGKSKLAQYYLLNGTNGRLNIGIPILISLRSLNNEKAKDISMLDIVYKGFCERYFNPGKEDFEYVMQKGIFLILFDGYDEVKEELKGKVLYEIDIISTKYNDNNFILFSRPRIELIGLTRFVELQLEPLSKEQALNLVQSLECNNLHVKEKFCEELNKELYEKYKSFVSNPLLLTILFNSYIGKASVSDSLSEFYEQALKALFEEHDNRKINFKRERKCNLIYDDFKKVFSCMCFKSFSFRSQFDFNDNQLFHLIGKVKEKLKINFNEDDYLEDLINIMCMLIEDGHRYKFAHFSFREYFAIDYAKKNLPDDIQAKVLKYILNY